MTYFDWHAAPGYWRDVTRNFGAADRLLDVGCGTGWVGAHFAQYTGVDISEEAVATAVANGIDAQVHDLGEPLPFPDGGFDGVLLKDILEHLLEPAALLREVHRVLRPGGVVFASSPDAQRWVWDDYTHVRPFTRTGFRRLFTDQGFTVRRAAYESVMPGTSIVSARTRGNRRPAPLRALTWLPIVRRNVTVVAVRP